MIVKVAVDLPQIEPLAYELDVVLFEKDPVGIWVLVPLRNKLMLGLVVEVVKSFTVNFKLKKIHKIINQLPKTDKDWLNLIHFSLA